MVVVVFGIEVGDVQPFVTVVDLAAFGMQAGIGKGENLDGVGGGGRNVHENAPLLTMEWFWDTII